MASISRLVNSYDVNSEEFELLVHDLMLDNNDIPFNSEEINIVQNIIITGINTRINQINTRYNGLLILDRILSRCSKDILLKHGMLWITKATQMLENVHSTAQDVTLACKSLGFLIEHCKEIPELHKQIAMQNVKQLINTINALQVDAWNGAVYYLLAILLYHYPEVCERYQGLIKNMILAQIDSTRKDLVNASAKCYILLSKATERSFKPPPAKSIYTGWMYHEVLLCNTLHIIMDQLFAELIELESVDIWDKLDLPSISEENIMHYYNTHKQRFSNLCVYLSSMLRGYEARNSVLPHDILGVLCRGLAITPLNLKDKTSFKEQMLYTIIPKLHICLLTVLDAFINGFTQELIPFGAVILQLFQQELEWTTIILGNHLTFGNSRPFKSVRIYTYKCLSSWLMNTGSMSGIETIATHCLTSILKDITPERDRILLTVQKTQHLTKWAVKRFRDSQYENSTFLNNIGTSATNTYLDADSCREALIVLQNILFSGSILLKQSFYKNLQNTVIPLLHHYYLGFPEQNFYKDHNECRLELFKTLKALQMNPSIIAACPIQHYLEISDMATRDVDLRIVQEAKLAVAELEKMIHVAAPTLQLPRQQEPDNEFIPENQEEMITSITLDKRNIIDQECFQDVDMIPPACKRVKINDFECQNSTELIEMDDNGMDLHTSQAKENSYEDTENILQEKDKIHCNKEEGLSNTNETTNIKNTASCASTTRTTIESPEQPKDVTSRKNVMDKMTEGRLPEVTEEVRKDLSVDDSVEREELEPEISDSINLFHDELKSND